MVQPAEGRLVRGKLHALAMPSCQRAVRCSTDSPKLGDRNLGDTIWKRYDRRMSDFVKPISLYQQQLQERLGKTRAASVGPFLLNPVGATNPSVEQAKQFVAASNAPARQLNDLIRKRWAAISAPDLTSAKDASSLARRDAQPNSHARLALQNGWLTVDGSLVVGGHLHTNLVARYARS